MYPCHPRPLCDHRRPCWQRSGRSCIARPEPLPLGPAAAANAPLLGMLERAWQCALRCDPRSAHLHHRRDFRALGCCRRRRSKLSGIQQLPAGRQEDLRPQLHQLALAWHAGKGTKDELSSTDNRAPFAVILAKNSSLRQRIAHCGRLARSRFALSAQSERLRSRLDPLDRE